MSNRWLSKDNLAQAWLLPTSEILVSSILPSRNEPSGNLPMLNSESLPVLTVPSMEEDGASIKRPFKYNRLLLRSLPFPG